MRPMNIFWKLWSTTQSKSFHILVWGRATWCLEIFSKRLSACKKQFKRTQKMLKHFWTWPRPTKPSKRMHGVKNGYKNVLISTKTTIKLISCSAIWRCKRRNFKKHSRFTIRSSRSTRKILKLLCILARSTKRRSLLDLLRNGSGRL